MQNIQKFNTGKNNDGDKSRKQTLLSQEVSIVHKERLPYWDLLKLFLIFLVIWGHCIRGFSTSDYVGSIIYRIIYSFHMPLFMMISGYFSVSSMSMEIVSFLQKKFWNLIYPCLIWGAILWGVLECLFSFHYGSDSFSISGILKDYYWLSNFWFLKSCFICYVLAYIGLKSAKRRWYILPTTLIVSQFISPFFVSFMYPCFIIGIVLRKRPVFFNWIIKHRLTLSVLFLLMLILWDEQVWVKSHGIPSDILDTGIDTWLEILYARIFRLSIGIVGSIAVVGLFSSFFRLNTKSIIVQTCCDWGRYTLYIYILQAVLLEQGLSHFICLDNIGTTMYELIVTPLISFILLYFFIYISKVMSYSPLLEKWLWGKTGLVIKYRRTAEKGHRRRACGCRQRVSAG